MNDNEKLFALIALRTHLITPTELRSAVVRLKANSEKKLVEAFVELRYLTEHSARCIEHIVDALTEKQVNDGPSLQALLTEANQLFVDTPEDPTSVSTIFLSDSEAGQQTKIDDNLPGARGIEKVYDRRFSIRELIANGGLGTVYLANDTQLNREVAVKKIRAHLKDEPDVVDRFFREAQITGKLEHPGIVPVYALGRDDSSDHYYAMKFVRGMSLKESIERFHSQTRGVRSRFRSPEFRGLLTNFLAICNALEYAHQSGVIHRDIKPANILLGKFGETLIVDWGLAKELGSTSEPGAMAEAIDPSLDSTAAGTILGTPRYAAPEQLLGNQEKVGRHSDIYSLGATLYEIVLGRPAIESDTISEMIRRVCHGEIAPARSIERDIPKALSAICQRAMDLDPDNRYRSVADLKDDLERWLNDLPVHASKESILESLARWMRQSQAVVFVVIGIALLSLMLALSVFISWGSGWSNDFRTYITPPLFTILFVGFSFILYRATTRLPWLRRRLPLSVAISTSTATLVLQLVVWWTFEQEGRDMQQPVQWFVTGVLLVALTSFSVAMLWGRSVRSRRKN